MSKKTINITVIVTSILLIFLYVISNTYSVIIDVIEDNNNAEIINNITIRDLLTDDNENYNNTYYEVMNRLLITESEANTIMDSIPMNNALQIILQDIVNFKLYHKNRMTKEEIKNIISDSTNEEDNIDLEIKEKIIIKSQEYIDDIYDYLYDIKVNVKGKQI